MTQLSAEASQLLTELKDIDNRVKNVADDARKNNDLSAAAKKAADDALTAQGELRAMLTDLAQHVASQTSAPGNAAPQTLGQQFVNSDAVQQYLANVSAGKLPSKAGVSATFEGVGLMNAVTSGAASAGDLKVPQYVPGIIPPGLQRLTIRDLLMWGTTSAASIQFFKELAFTNNAGIQSEEITALGVSDVTFEADSAAVVTIGHTLPASEQIMADVPQLQSYIDGRLRYGLKLKEEAQLLNGSGVGVNLKGLRTAASNYSNPGVTVVSENRMDRLRLAICRPSCPATTLTAWC
jgi:HK97 family phage major capsid protein